RPHRATPRVAPLAHGGAPTDRCGPCAVHPSPTTYGRGGVSRGKGQSSGEWKPFGEPVAHLTQSSTPFKKLIDSGGRGGLTAGYPPWAMATWDSEPSCRASSHVTGWPSLLLVPGEAASRPILHPPP